MGGVGRKGGGAGGRFTIAGLLILICGVRLFGGVAMLLKGAAVTNEVLAGDLSVRALGLLMMSIAGVGLRAGVGLFTKPERWWRVGVWATIALWVDGLLNGLVLFGAPRVWGASAQHHRGDGVEQQPRPGRPADEGGRASGERLVQEGIIAFLHREVVQPLLATLTSPKRTNL